MSSRPMRCLAVLLAVVFAAQPAMAVGKACRDQAPADTGSAALMAAPALADELPPPPDEPPASEPESEATPPDADGRAQIAAELVELGYDPAAAGEMASLLTPADLEVLLGNPRMMQRAGAMSAQTQAFIIGGLLVAGVVALAVAGSASVHVN